MTVAELVAKLRIAEGKMSRKNEHRLLLMQCEDALIQLAARVGELSVSQETPNAPTDPHTV